MKREKVSAFRDVLVRRDETQRGEVFSLFLCVLASYFLQMFRGRF